MEEDDLEDDMADEEEEEEDEEANNKSSKTSKNKKSIYADYEEFANLLEEDLYDENKAKKYIKLTGSKRPHKQYQQKGGKGPNKRPRNK